MTSKEKLLTTCLTLLMVFQCNALPLISSSILPVSLPLLHLEDCWEMQLKTGTDSLGLDKLDFLLYYCVCLITIRRAPT